MTPVDWMNDSHVRSNCSFVTQHIPGMGEVHAARMPGHAGLFEEAMRPAPGIGQHSRAILSEASYAAAEIDRLIERRVVHAGD